ncbi:NifB/NifX family molybdenum-iron cluster-binding protein [Clostridium thailandense]|uniref:NifB/NifX family molybdenum-iron cluster-binding protein n=1 Tax=Clostridium thailandense TaxID=2794346 RepID=UPI003989EEB0
MNIAVAAEGKNLDSQVSEKFGKCLYLLIIKMEDLSITVVKNDESFENLSEENLVGEVLKHDCEALIIGDLELKSFNVLADAGITRYYGVGHSVEKALELMEQGSLKLIRNHDGTNDCSGHHHH